MQGEMGHVENVHLREVARNTIRDAGIARITSLAGSPSGRSVRDSRVTAREAEKP